MGGSAGVESVRLDKWLQVACIFKTRTQAAEACLAGRVAVNGKVSKPHRILRSSDRIEIRRHGSLQVLIVKELRDKPVAKALARLLYEDVSPPPLPADPLDELLRRSHVFRERGAGRPTKKESRRIRRLKDI